MDKTLAVQLQIRQNAEEISSALKDIGSWEKNIKGKDKDISKKKNVKNSPASTSEPISAARRGGGTVPLKLQSKHGMLCIK